MAEALNSYPCSGNPTTETEEDTMKAPLDEAQNGNGTKRKYSRKDLENLRFLNFEQQRQIWKGIYIGFDTAVAKEYDSLASNEHQKHIRWNYDPRQRCAKKQDPPILSAIYCENMDNDMQHMDSGAKLTPVDASCNNSVASEDGYSILE